MRDEDYLFTTKIRHLINKLLSPLHIQISTNVKEQEEKNFLTRLKDRGHWREQKYLKGLKLNDEDYLNFLEEVLSNYESDFRKLSNDIIKGSSDFYLRNEFFSSVDAEVLYSMIRFYKPGNIIEVGSGFSTRLMRSAINDGDLSTKIICIDPQPRVDILEHADEHFAMKVEDMPAGKLLNKISAGDILFIDSSHITATGSDVNYLFLEILPELPAGVFIHIHDIYFPFDYPEEWVINERWGWNEQYLVHAFLMFNDSFEIIWPSYYMLTRHEEKIKEKFSPLIDNYKPSSLWIKKLNSGLNS